MYNDKNVEEKNKIESNGFSKKKKYIIVHHSSDSVYINAFYIYNIHNGPFKT